MKSALAILFIILFYSFLAGCGPKHLGPELTKEGIHFSLYAPEAKSVAIAGSFNSWNTEKDRMSGPDKGGVWFITLLLPPGRYEYLFVINTKKWQSDPSMPEVDDGFGAKNSVLVVPEEKEGM